MTKTNFRSASIFTISARGMGAETFRETSSANIFQAPLVRKMREEKTSSTLSLCDMDSLCKGLRYFLNDDLTAGFALTAEGAPVCMWAFEKKGMMAIVNLTASNDTMVDGYNDAFVSDTFGSISWPTDVCEWFQSERVRGHLVKA